MGIKQIPGRNVVGSFVLVGAMRIPSEAGLKQEAGDAITGTDSSLIDQLPVQYSRKASRCPSNLIANQLQKIHI
jgi:hypothetical protein